MRFNYRSQAIGHYVDITVALPTDGLSYYDPASAPKANAHPGFGTVKPVYKPGMKFQTVYLIHGGGDDDTLTYRYTNAERYAQDHHLMLVTPNVTNSFGAEAEYGVPYATFLTEELPTLIRSLFPSSEKREDNFIMGYAMGGNVALGMALMRPDLYAACVDISGGIGFTVRTDLMIEELQSDHFRNGFKLFSTTFGEPEKFAGSKNDLMTYVKKHQADGTPFSDMTVICGSKEFIRKRVEGDVERMKEVGLDVNYIVAEGYDHDFIMWDKYIKVAFDEILPLKNSPIYPAE